MSIPLISFHRVQQEDEQKEERMMQLGTLVRRVARMTATRGPIGGFEGAAKRTFLTVIPQYERGVTFFLGRFQTVKGPGLRLLLPVLQEMHKIDIRTQVSTIQAQHIMTKDNVAAQVSAAVYFRIEDPAKAVNAVADVTNSVITLARTTLRDALCRQDFNEILKHRTELAETIHEAVGHQADEWGVKIIRVQMDNIDLIDPDMVRALAKEAEALRERKAAIIRAEGELEAAHSLAKASSVILGSPGAIELRRLQTIEKIAKEKGQHTVIVPVDLAQTTLGLSAAAVSQTSALPHLHDSFPTPSPHHHSSSSSSSSSPKKSESKELQALEELLDIKP